MAEVIVPSPMANCQRSTANSVCYPPAASLATTSMNVKKRLLDGARMTRAIRRMAIEILEKNRGHRELPIHADVIGKTVPTDANEVIKVKMAETDEEDEVLIMEK